MAYRPIPKKFDLAQIASDLKNILQYSAACEPGAIKRIAAELGCSVRTVYAYLDGQINLNLDFMHAAVIATANDPEIRRFLEPTGYCLVPCDSSLSPDKKTQAEECLDDHSSVAAFHKAVMSPESSNADVKRALDAAVKELKESYQFRLKQGGGRQ